MKISVTTKTIRVDYCHMYALHRAALGMIENPSDPHGPIDALVPWYAAPLFIKAVAQATGSVPACSYERPGTGHITSPGRRAAMDLDMIEANIRLVRDYPYRADGTRNTRPEAEGDTEFD